MSISFARIASGTTTVAGTNAYSAYTPQPTLNTSQAGDLTGQEVSDFYLQHVFTKPYLDAHTLSWPSFRYSYYFWFGFAALFLIWVILHQLQWRAGSIGLWFRKIGMRKFSFGSQRVVTASSTTALSSEKGMKRVSLTRPQRGSASSFGGTTPTVSQMLGLTVLLIFLFCLSYVGPDYIIPTNCLFSNTYCGFVAVNGDNATDQYGGSRLKRALVASSDMIMHVFSKRRRARYGWSPLSDPLLSGPNYEIDKSFWTSSSRVGLIAYAILPLCVSLALKQWPMNAFATPWLTNLGIDKTAVWHRWIGRIIWAMSTVHTGLWTKQLFVDLNPFNEPTWNTSWAWHRLLAGGIAYGFLTAMVAFSFKPLRNRYYEIFYYSHIALALGFLVTIIIHYQALQGWCLLAACLWALERLVRFCIFLYLNYSVGTPVFGEGRVGKAQFTSRDASSGGFKVHHVEKRMSADTQKYSQLHPPSTTSSMRTAVHNPYGTEEWSAASASTYNLHDPSQSGYSDHHVRRPPQPVYAYGPGNDDVNSSSHSRDQRQLYVTPLPLYSAPRNGSIASLPSHPRPQYALRTIPKGYALAQVLPGRVIRLTIHTQRHMSWKPGQHVMLTIPSARWWQGHPYSIVNSQELTERRGSAQAGGSEIVLLLSARKGFSQVLYSSIADKRKRLIPGGASHHDARDPSAHAMPGVLIRAQTYLPTGSAARVRWDEFSSVVIVAAGTGVTYAMSVLEHLCHTMALKESALRGEPQGLKGKTFHPTEVTRVRFVWILRDYAHLSWIAPALRRCLDISEPSRLRIDLFVTSDIQTNLPMIPASAFYDNGNYKEEASGHFSPPRPRFAGHTRTMSIDSTMSDTVVGNNGSEYSGIHLVSTEIRQQSLPAAVGEDFSVTDMILFDGEEETTSPVDEEFSKTIRKEGKIRRALSRKNKSVRDGRPQALRAKTAKHERNGSRFQEDLGEFSADEPDLTPPLTLLAHGNPVGSQIHNYPPHPGVAAFGSTDSRKPSIIDSDFGYGDSSQRGRIPIAKRMSSAGIPLLAEADTASVDLDDYDREDLNIIAELAHGGKPDISAILDAEIERSQGKIVITACGPKSLNNLVRRLAGQRISPGKIRNGDRSGHVEFISEDFDY